MLTILEGATFCVCDETGDIEEAIAGFFALDTRFLSRLRLTIDGVSPRLLDGRQVEYFSALVFLRNDLSARLGADELLIRRERFVAGHLHERVVLANVSQRDLAVRVGIELAADFADILTVKQHDIALGQPDHAPAFPESVRPVPSPDPLQVVIVAPDGDLRTAIAASLPLSLDDDGVIAFDVELARHAEWTFELTAEPCADGEPPRLAPATHQFGHERQRTADALRSWQLSVPRLRAADAAIERAFHRSIVDLAALRMPVAGVDSARLPAAGVPWFMTIFGRDTLITCLQTLLLGPDLARTALRALADIQAVADDPAIDAEPGKIVHELRKGRAAQTWFPRYYGSVDATPLFLILLSEVWRWTGDDALIEELRPAALAALGWIDDRGDLDGDGFVEFARRAPRGLEIQSWKDSWDSQRYADGRIAQPPIAAAEVQGYVFDAKTRLAEIALVVWRDPELSARLEHEAAVLSQQFDRSFWIEQGGGYYALALDRDKRQVDSHCSNMGQLLWSGIVPSHRVDAVSDQLFSDGLWSGWGVRTMSRHDRAYGPLAYHNGTVWPHDNSLIAWGLERYGRYGDACRIARALLDASGEFGHALPEVFTGLARSTTPFPVPYPTANRPQAWAAATPVLLLRIMLGLEPDRERRAIVSRCTDRLPEWLEGTTLEGIPAYGTAWDAVVDDGAVRVTPTVRSPP